MTRPVTAVTGSGAGSRCRSDAHLKHTAIRHSIPTNHTLNRANFRVGFRIVPRVERLLEREGVLSRLGALTRAARGGEGQAVLLRGEAGAGKTAVITKFTAALGLDVRVSRG